MAGIRGDHDDDAEASGGEDGRKAEAGDGDLKKFTFPAHQSHMVSLAKMCQENQEYTDCVILCGDGADSAVEDGQSGNNRLKAHRLVLGAVSPFLQMVFKDMSPNLAEATILVPGVKRRVVSALLDFLYTGEMTVDRSETGEMQVLIETLQIDPSLISVDLVEETTRSTAASPPTGCSEPIPASSATGVAAAERSPVPHLGNQGSEGAEKSLSRKRRRRSGSGDEDSEEQEMAKLSKITEKQSDEDSKKDRCPSPKQRQ